jgi:hypothetical protein
MIGKDEIRALASLTHWTLLALASLRVGLSSRWPLLALALLSMALPLMVARGMSLPYISFHSVYRSRRTCTAVPPSLPLCCSCMPHVTNHTVAFIVRTYLLYLPPLLPLCVTCSCLISLTALIIT